jgi:hypothetical protein
VFTISDKLILCKGVEHEIETTADLSYELLYNLLERELAALREYIVIALEKS